MPVSGLVPSPSGVVCPASETRSSLSSTINRLSVVRRCDPSSNNTERMSRRLSWWSTWHRSVRVGHQTAEHAQQVSHLPTNINKQPSGPGGLSNQVDVRPRWSTRYAALPAVHDRVRTVYHITDSHSLSSVHKINALTDLV